MHTGSTMDSMVAVRLMCYGWWMKWSLRHIKGEKVVYEDRGDKSLIDLLKAFQFKKEIQAKLSRYSTTSTCCQVYQNTHLQANQNWLAVWYIAHLQKIWWNDWLFWLAHVVQVTITTKKWGMPDVWWIVETVRDIKNTTWRIYQAIFNVI